MKLYQNAYVVSKSIDARAETRGAQLFDDSRVPQLSIIRFVPAIPQYRVVVVVALLGGFCDVSARAKAGHVTYAFTIRIDISSLGPFFVHFYWMVTNFIFNLCGFFCLFNLI